MNRLEILQARIERLMKLTQSGKLSQKDIERANRMLKTTAIERMKIESVYNAFSEIWNKNTEKFLQDLRKSALPSGVSYPHELFKTGKSDFIP